MVSVSKQVSTSSHTERRCMACLGPVTMREHISSALQTLYYWLPICYLIRFKIALLMYRLYTAFPDYIKNIVAPITVTPIDSNYDLPPDLTSSFYHAP